MNNKTTAMKFFVMVVFFAASVFNASAKKDHIRYVQDDKADTVVMVIRDTVYVESSVGDTDDNGISRIMNQYQLEAFKAKIDLERESNKLEYDAKIRREKIHNDYHIARNGYNIISSYVSLFFVCVILPILVIFLYWHYTQNQQRRREILIDLLRTGVDIKPEVFSALGVSKLNWSIANMGRSDIGIDNYNFCIRRVALAVCFLVVGIAISCISNDEIPFGLSLVIAIIILMQAVVRYLSARNMAKTMRNDNVMSDNNGNADGNA